MHHSPLQPKCHCIINRQERHHNKQVIWSGYYNCWFWLQWEALDQGLHVLERYKQALQPNIAIVHYYRQKGWLYWYLIYLTTNFIDTALIKIKVKLAKMYAMTNRASIKFIAFWKLIGPLSRDLKSQQLCFMIEAQTMLGMLQTWHMVYI